VENNWSSLRYQIDAGQQAIEKKVWKRKQKSKRRSWEEKQKETRAAREKKENYRREETKGEKRKEGDDKQSFNFSNSS
jgi:hypothetical protein